MKRFVFFLAFIILAITVMAQGNDKNSGLTRKQKKEAELEKAYQLTKQMLENKNFVLESDFLENRYGYRVPVVSNLNFISVDSTQAIIQIGSNSRIGPNGVGGVTAKGNITQWDLKVNEKQKTFTLRINVMTTIGIYDVFFDIMASGQSRALLTGLSSGRLTFDGRLVQPGESSIYVGHSP